MRTDETRHSLIIDRPRLTLPHIFDEFTTAFPHFNNPDRHNIHDMHNSSNVHAMPALFQMHRWLFQGSTARATTSKQCVHEI